MTLAMLFIICLQIFKHLVSLFVVSHCQIKLNVKDGKDSYMTLIKYQMEHLYDCFDFYRLFVYVGSEIGKKNKIDFLNPFTGILHKAV